MKLKERNILNENRILLFAIIQECYIGSVWSGKKNSWIFILVHLIQWFGLLFVVSAWIWIYMFYVMQTSRVCTRIESETLWVCRVSINAINPMNCVHQNKEKKSFCYMSNWYWLQHERKLKFELYCFSSFCFYRLWLLLVWRKFFFRKNYYPS